MNLFDVDRRQYQLLLTLFRQLSARRELTGRLGLDRRMLALASATYGVAGVILSLMVLAHLRASVFLGLCLALTTFFLIPSLIADAADAFMNPAEASLLAHLPIQSGAYVAAKATYVVNASVRVVLPLNSIPAVSGLLLSDTRWFYPVTHMIAVLLAGVFTAFLTCGLFGLLFRFVPIAKLRAAAMWTQIVTGIAIPLAPQLFRFVRFRPDVDARVWSALPLMWFDALGLVGQAGRPTLMWPIALPGMVLSAAFIAFGARSLSRDYLTRVVMMMRAQRRDTRGEARLNLMARFIRLVTGNPSGVAAFGFLIRMAVRDWHFRRFFLQTMVTLIVFSLIATFRKNGADSPFASEGLVPAHFVPHVLGLALLTACSLLTQSDQSRAAWIFLTVPMGGLRAFVRGVFWSLWVPAVALPHLLLMAVAVWRWGLPATLAFLAYSAGVDSFYLSVSIAFVRGLPFATPARSAPSALMFPLTITYFIVAGILIALQFFVLFHSMRAVVAAAIVFGAAAAVTAPFSLRTVEKNVMLNLDRLTAGSVRVFRGLDEG